MPKLNRYAKAGMDSLESVTNTNDKRLISASFRATQAYVMTACVAVGLLQVCSLLFADEINASPLRWLRTKSNDIVNCVGQVSSQRAVILSAVWDK